MSHLPRQPAIKPERDATGIDTTYPGSGYEDYEIEFLRAVEAWQKKHKRKFPTFTQVLEIARSLGYRRVAQPVTEEVPPCDTFSPSPPSE